MWGEFYYFVFPIRLLAFTYARWFLDSLKVSMFSIYFIFVYILWRFNLIDVNILLAPSKMQMPKI